MFRVSTLSRVIFVCSTVALISGCARKPSDIAPSYISSVPYQGLSCPNLEAEAELVSSRAAAAMGVQEDKAGKDAALVGVTLILFWPAAFFIGGDDVSAAEVARLKGEMEAIETASARNGCGIVFNRA